MAQFFQINKLATDQYGHPAIVNAIGSMDVDFIIDEGQDAINMQADAFGVLQSLGPQFAQQFPEIAIELSPIEQVVKTKMLKKIQAAQQAPPKPDPKIMALQAKAQIDAQTAQNNMQIEQAKAQQAAVMDRQRQSAEMQFKHDSMLMDGEMERQRAAVQMRIEQEKAQHQLELERIKAANAIQIERERANVQNDLARQKGEVDRQNAKKKKAKVAA